MRLIIVGASSSIGHAVYTQAQQKKTKTIGTYFSRPVLGLVSFNANTQSLTEIAPDLGAQDVVLFLSAIARVDAITQDLNQALQLNVESTQRLLKQAMDMGSRVIFMSTNQVFDGKKDGGYVESDSVHPLNAYGEQKTRIEQFLMTSSNKDNWMIARTGWNISPRAQDPCLVVDTCRALLSPSARMAKDNILNVTDVSDTAAVLHDLATDFRPGIWHVANPAPISRFELAELICKKSKLGRQMRFVEVNYADLPTSSSRPAKAWLRSERANFHFHSVEQVVEKKLRVFEKEIQNEF